MQYILIALVMFWLGWMLGRKYQDFQDLMIARRVAKLVDQREQVSNERDQYEKWERQDNRIKRVMEDDEDDRSIHRNARARQNVSNDKVSDQAYEERNSSIR